MTMSLARCLNGIWTLALVFVSATFCHAALPELVTGTGGMTAQQEQMLITAFEDAINLARTVALKWSEDPACDPYFDRYFPPTETTFVEQMFRTMADIPLDIDLNTLVPFEVQQFVASLRPDRLSEKFEKLSISYGSHPSLSTFGPSEADVCSGPDDQADTSFDPYDPDQAWISLCPYVFDTWFSLADTERPPAYLVAEGIPGLTCAGLGSTETDYMWSPGAVLLHELFHWPYLFKTVSDYKNKIRRDPDGQRAIEDYEGESRPDVTAPNPVNGYDAFSGRLLRNVPNDENGYVEAVNNADSYACYATVRKWDLTCDRYFGPAINQGDWAHRSADPEIPHKRARIKRSLREWDSADLSSMTA